MGKSVVAPAFIGQLLAPAFASSHDTANEVSVIMGSNELAERSAIVSWR
jgi:hypothetical protein